MGVILSRGLFWAGSLVFHGKDWLGVLSFFGQRKDIPRFVFFCIHMEAFGLQRWRP